MVFDVAVERKLIGFIRIEIEGDTNTPKQTLIKRAKQAAQKMLDAGWPVDYEDPDGFDCPQAEIVGAYCVDDWIPYVEAAAKM